MSRRLRKASGRETGVVIRISGGSRRIRLRSVWRVPGPDPDRKVHPDPFQRGAQVALDVGKAPERRYIDQPHPGFGASRPRRPGGCGASRSIPRGSWPGSAGAGRSADQRVERRDRLPAERLGRVAPSNEAENQRRTSSLKGASGSWGGFRSVFRHR